MCTQDDENWFKILGGQSVPDADPETVEEAMALRGALRARRERRHLPPLRLPEPVKTPKRQNPLFNMWSYAVAASLLVVVLAPIIMYTLQEPGVEKAYSVDFQELITYNPQNTAQKIHQALQAQGIQSTQEKENELWIVDIQFKPAQRSALNEILARYHLQPPSSEINQLIVEINQNEQPTTP